MYTQNTISPALTWCSFIVFLHLFLEKQQKEGWNGHVDNYPVEELVPDQCQVGLQNGVEDMIEDHIYKGEQ